MNNYRLIEYCSLHGSVLEGFILVFPFRRLYILSTYLLLGFNVLYAGAMSFLRILGALVFNICMVFRLDRDLYMRGLEGWDLGTRCSARVDRKIPQCVCVCLCRSSHVRQLYVLGKYDQ